MLTCTVLENSSYYCGNSFPFRGKAGMGVGRVITHPHPNPLLRFKCALALEGEGIKKSDTV